MILVAVFLLIALGFLFLASASSDLGKVRFDNAYYYIWRQIIYGASVGLVGFFLALKIPYKNLKPYTFYLLIASVGLVALTFTPLGIVLGGARRWLQFGPFVFQPAEILKFTFIMYLAAWLSSERKNRSKSFYNGFLPFIVLSGTIGGLLLLQRSTSAVLITMLSALCVYFISGAKWRYILAVFGLGALVLPLVIYFTPYRLERVLTFLDPAQDTSGASYQIDRAKVTIGSGGFLGVGYGNSVTKQYLPERIGDSIFAIIAEEFGFVGASSLILLYSVLVLRGLMVAKNIGEPFGRLLLAGISIIIGLQAFTHIGAISGVIPLTGVPLPFISYGGTALAVFMIAAGLMLNVTKRG
ncbi:MAG: cell division protein FtsW [Candidatus Colwellbacteria bacterium]|nr:cell division protein FtsW [Candidatus Colwellbacteria bacterium]